MGPEWPAKESCKGKRGKEGEERAVMVGCPGYRKRQEKEGERQRQKEKTETETLTKGRQAGDI